MSEEQTGGATHGIFEQEPGCVFLDTCRHGWDPPKYYVPSVKHRSLNETSMLKVKSTRCRSLQDLTRSGRSPLKDRIY